MIREYFPYLLEHDNLQYDIGPMDHVQGVGVFASHPILYIPRDETEIHLQLMEWGIIEHFRKVKPDMKNRNFMLNARSERILNDPKVYWNKIQDKRCLIPVTGTYEHRGIQGWKKKVPYFIKPCDQTVFFLPGLYSRAELADVQTGEVIPTYTFSMITRAANEVMRNIHNDGENRWRMPLFLPLEMSKEFLSKDLSKERYAEILAYEMPSEDLQYFPVATIATAKLREDGLDKDAPYEWAKLPALGELNPM